MADPPPIRRTATKPPPIPRIPIAPSPAKTDVVQVVVPPDDVSEDTRNLEAPDAGILVLLGLRPLQLNRRGSTGARKENEERRK